MTINAMNLFLSLARDLGAAKGKGKKVKDPFVESIMKAIKSERVWAHLLRPELESAGYTVNETKRKVLTQIDVLDGEVLIASGTSGDDEDALLQAALGYVKERAAQQKAAA
jgi:hypothetical protein